MAEMDIVPYIGTRTPADFDMLFDELEAARGSSASLSDAIAEKADKATTLSGYGITDAYTKDETGTKITNAISALDVSSAGGSGKYISAISETDGKISPIVETIDTQVMQGSTNPVQNGAIYDFVNSSVATNTAYFIGTFNSLSDLENYSGEVSNNDYAFVVSVDSNSNTVYNRYKYNSENETWNFEYSLNNSSFTAAEWETIQSGLTANDRTNYNNHLANTNNPHSVTKAQVGLGNVDNTSDADKPISTAMQIALSGKQNTLTFDGTYDASTNKAATVSTITNAINDLDVSSVGGSGKYISAISEADGKISATADNIADSPASGGAAPISSGAVYTALASKQDALSQAQLAAANSGITAAKLTADEAALAEVVDNGAKNIADLTSATKTTYTTATFHGVTITRNGDIFTVSGTSDTNDNAFFNIYYEGSTTTKIIPPGNWVALIENYTGDVVKDIAVQIAAPAVPPAKPYGTPVKFSLSGSESGNWLRVSIRPSTTYNGSFRLMICKAADWAISKKFVPYCPSMAEMYEMILALQNGTRSAPALAKAEPEEIKEPETGEEEMR